MKQFFIGALLLMTGYVLTAQELYVFSEPASNVPAKSVSVKYSGKFLKSSHNDRIEQRHMPEVMLGLSKEWMLRASTTMSDMYSSNLRWESAKLYTKYRFLSNDDVHRHFRMAAFAEASYSRNEMMYDELSLEGDQSGIQGGVILTQLWDKLAVSTTLGYLQVIQSQPPLHHVGMEKFPEQAFNYSLSAGYLLLPRHYTSYKQTNVNLYAELLGQQTLDNKKFYVDFAPAIQFIFNSTAKLNAGYRIQLNSDMNRMAQNRLQLSFEYVFLNALKKKR
ncbi:hypothetical protein [Pseudobacter ginsenosidimutans]|uniref:Uncharacterized protein n=1 Tax=Pseudobacter ginsenosidimutans TaxID=661488 RepID=A0A4Q7MZY9_9BACT|nr:hypothetical protein [Pseudobacter ginsenosidimutans]QEC43493.1 hypothetical protein FSB84_18030 [Pseudobacter ginsenosidimutans]RZS74881.1 hypothetical protein EV199_0732 [Pseudobacter ginsenosidimutans]